MSKNIPGYTNLVNFNHEGFGKLRFPATSETKYDVEERGIVKVTDWYDQYGEIMPFDSFSELVIPKEVFVKAYDMFIKEKEDRYFMAMLKIKPGMAIHCKTLEEANLLYNNTSLKLDNFFGDVTHHWCIYGKDTCYSFNRYETWSYSHYDHYKEDPNYEIIEFKDLIVTEDNLPSVVETIEKLSDKIFKDDKEDKPVAEKTMSSREELIQRIKDCGQYIIDNAESILGNEKYIKELYCTCNFFDKSEPPYVTITKDVIPDSFVERFK